MNLDYMDPTEIIDRAKFLITEKAEIKNLKCVYDIKEAIPKRIKCDMQRLMQVIINITGNSIKYTFEGSITMQLSRNRSGNYLKIKITDTGVGIPEENLILINKLFGLLENKINNNQTGICLGLAISKSIINAMNGELIITSKIGLGTTCKILIPIGETTHSKLDKFNDSELLNKSITRQRILSHKDSEFCMYVKKPRVIIIDDEPLVQLALGMVLSKLGCHTEKASNGKIGLDMVNKSIVDGTQYDMVFMDANKIGRASC